ncbi:conserved hypothetical protein [Trichinella spiralis]|uniref:hypothetical protein n=1 Tax=Trichinella spiralis TaxID=6334 RepID=UPI0001EFD7DA|nr:conserved hypothetical protein [Trichinella spiralis]
MRKVLFHSYYIIKVLCHCWIFLDVRRGFIPSGERSIFFSNSEYQLYYVCNYWTGQTIVCQHCSKKDLPEQLQCVTDFKNSVGTNLPKQIHIFLKPTLNYYSNILYDFITLFPPQHPPWLKLRISYSTTILTSTKMLKRMKAKN